MFRYGNIYGMAGCGFIWAEGAEREPGNLPHLKAHGVTPEEAAYVVDHPSGHDRSRTTGSPIAFGYTPAGRHLAVVYTPIGDGMAGLVYVDTAYDTPPRMRGPRQRNR